MQEVPLDPHQRDAVAKLSNGKILCGGVGAGKTRVALQYYIEKEAPKDVIVITTAKKRDSLDWESEAVLHGLGTSAEATFHGVLTVDSWNNLWKYANVKDAFFVFDEQRVVGSGKWVQAFYKVARANRWILLSATPGDTWLDYIPVFVANGFYKNKTEFLREHVVYSRFSKFPKVERYIAVGRLVRHRNALLVDMPFERHTTRHLHTIDVDYDVELFDKVVKKRWNPFESRPLKDVAELFMVMRKIVNGDASRLEAVRSLITQHPKLIVFYNFDYELEMLRTLAEAPTTNLEESWPISTISETLDSSSPMTSSSLNGSDRSSGRSSTSPLESSSESMLGTEMVSSTSMSRGSLQPSVPSTEWDGTIWEKSWTPETQNDPRLSVENQKARAKYELAMARSASTTTASSGLPTLPSTRTQSSSGSTPTSSSGQNGVMADGQSISPEANSHTTVAWTSRTRSMTDEADSSTKDDTQSSGPTDVSGRPTEQSISPKANSHVAIAEWNGHKHEPIPKTDHWVYLVQYLAGAEGWNCIETDTVVFFSLNYSYRIFEQCQGRIDRMNTPFYDLHYYALRSKSAIDSMIWKALKKKESFNERKSAKAFEQGVA